MKKLKTFEENSFIHKKVESNNFKRIFDLSNKKFKEFKVIFSFGLDAYLQGNWDHSKKFLSKAIKLIPDDAPTKVILNFMERNNFQTPPDWRNFREIEE